MNEWFVQQLWPGRRRFAICVGGLVEATSLVDFRSAERKANSLSKRICGFFSAGTLLLQFGRWVRIVQGIRERWNDDGTFDGHVSAETENSGKPCNKTEKVLCLNFPLTRYKLVHLLPSPLSIWCSQCVFALKFSPVDTLLFWKQFSGAIWNEHKNARTDILQSKRGGMRLLTRERNWTTVLDSSCMSYSHTWPDMTCKPGDYRNRILF